MKESVVENAIALGQINNKFDKIVQTIEYIKEKQDEMAEDIAIIKEAVYNPNEGLYARLRELEGWKESSSRLMWLIITSILTLAAATFYKVLNV